MRLSGTARGTSRPLQSVLAAVVQLGAGPLRRLLGLAGAAVGVVDAARPREALMAKTEVLQAVTEPEPDRLVPGSVVTIDSEQMTVRFEPSGFWTSADRDRHVACVIHLVESALKVWARRVDEGTV